MRITQRLCLGPCREGGFVDQKGEPSGLGCTGFCGGPGCGGLGAGGGQKSWRPVGLITAHSQEWAGARKLWGSCGGRRAHGFLGRTGCLQGTSEQTGTARTSVL